MTFSGGHFKYVYYGWVVLAATALTEMIALGTTSYAAGLFVVPLERELGFTRATTNNAIAILFGGGIVMAPLVGRLLDRYSVRVIMTIGGLALGASFAVIASTSSPALMAAVLVLPGAFGFIAIGSLTTATLVSRWFYRHRGLALGIATVATSGGGIIVVPLLSAAIITFGWRAALLWEAALVAGIVSAIAIFVVRNTPIDKGLETHAENSGRPASDFIYPESPARMSRPLSLSQWRAILSSRNFWAIVIAPASVSALAQAIVITLAPYGEGLGFSAPAAALLISAFSVAAAAAKIASGILADRFDRRRILFGATLAMTAALLLLISSSQYGVLLVAACFAGVALGGVLPSCAALIAGCFGAPSFGAVMGWGYALTGVLTIFAVRFVGAMYDRNGNYDEAFLIFAALAAAASFAPLLVRLPAQGPPVPYETRTA